MSAVRGGDHRAFTTLYRANVGAVQLAVRDNVHEPEAVADVVQETFTRAFERLPSLREPSRFRPWLLAIARHAAVDHRRARQRVRVDNGVDVDALVSPDRSPSEEAELSEITGLVNDAVAVMSHRDATAITLTSRFGFGPDAIAVALGVTPGAAKVIVHRARRRLRHALTFELMVRAQNRSCPAFSELQTDADRTVAARHVRDCDVCLDSASLCAG